LSILRGLSKTNDPIIKDLIVQDYVGMGTLLTSINGYKNGINNKYWQYYVNGEQPMVSIDKYIPFNDDFIELKFIEPQF